MVEETPIPTDAETGATATPECPAPEAPHVTLSINPAPDRSGRFLVVAVNCVGDLNRDTIDLNSAISRNRFLTATMGKVFTNPKDDRLPQLLADLEKQLLDAAKVPPGPEAASATSPEAPVDPRIGALAKMTESVRAEAVAMLSDPDLVKRISADIAVCGVVGEKRTAMSLYMVGVSAQLDRPLSAAVRGSSSSGKSFVVGCVSKMVPPEVVLEATSITTNALYYFPPGTLMHRWVVAGERSRMEDDDRAEATRALREMIESGRLSKAVPGKDANGKIVTELIEQEGPIAFTETTTLTQIFEEDANRMLLLSSDETEEQTKKILAATAAGLTGAAKANVERIRAVHHAMHRMIPRTDVEIPYADIVAELFPTDRIDSRRSFRHLLQMVKAVALLHFQQRHRTPDGNLIADLNDYKVAVSLVSGPLAASRGDLGDATRRFFGTLKVAFGEHEFDSNAAQKAGKLQRSLARGRLTELANASLVEQTLEAKGNKPAKWRLTGTDFESVSGGIPTFDVLQERVSGRTVGRDT